MSGGSRTQWSVRASAELGSTKREQIRSDILFARINKQQGVTEIGRSDERRLCCSVHSPLAYALILGVARPIYLQCKLQLFLGLLI